MFVSAVTSTRALSHCYDMEINLWSRNLTWRKAYTRMMMVMMVD